RGWTRISPFTVPMLMPNGAAGWISIEFGAKAGAHALVSACPSGAESIGYGIDMIRSGRADVVLAGGAEAAIMALNVGAFAVMRAMSTRNDEPERASRPFDKDRDGFVLGEGAGVVILEELEHAKKRGATILAELTGYGLTADAYHMTSPAPGGAGAVKAMQHTLKRAGVAADQIDYINAHGTSTPVGDVAETEAIKAVFGEAAKSIAVSSTKSMTGHLLGAAGAAELIFCIKAIQENIIPPTINLDNPDPHCDLDYVPHKPREQKVDVAMSNS